MSKSYLSLEEYLHVEKPSIAVGDYCRVIMQRPNVYACGTGRMISFTREMEQIAYVKVKEVCDDHTIYCREGYYYLPEWLEKVNSCETKTPISL